MHYGLSNSPAAQPRNSVCGMVVAASLAIFFKTVIFKKIPGFPVLCRVPFASSFAIAVTLKLGLTHPPAGAVAVLFSTDDDFADDWVALGLLCFGYVEAILLALVFVNLSESRTFPMYWGFVPTNCCKKENEFDSESAL